MGMNENLPASLPQLLALSAWAMFAIVWVSGAFLVKRTIQREAMVAQVGQVLLWGTAFTLLVIFPVHPSARDQLQWVGLPLTLGGLGFAIWARFHLGRNWSALATIKHDHELVTSGPYGLVRHPIYTGLIGAAVGSVLVFQHLPGVVATLMILVGVVIKIRVEERIMRERFGSVYEVYTREVKSLIPWVW